MDQPAYQPPALGWTVPPPPGMPEPARAREVFQPRAVLGGLAIAATVAVLGVPFGLLWSLIAPDVPILVTQAGPALGEPQPEQLIAADGWFAILAVPFGVLVAVGAWAAGRRSRGAAGLLGLSAGAVVAGLVGWWVGRQIGLAGYQAALAAAGPGTELARPADLGVAEVGWWPPRALGVVLVPGLAAAITYTMLAAWSRFPSLRPEPVPPGSHDLDGP